MHKSGDHQCKDGAIKEKGVLEKTFYQKLRGNYMLIRFDIVKNVTRKERKIVVDL